MRRGQRGSRPVRVWWKATREERGIGGLGHLVIAGTSIAPRRLSPLLASRILLPGQVDCWSRVESERSAGGQ